MNIPEKFKLENGEINIDGLLKSYLELEKKLSQNTAAKTINLPEASNAYEIDLSHGLFDLDDELNERMFELGFSKEQAQLVYDMAAEKLVPLVQDIAVEFRSETEIEKLKSEFGGEEKFNEIARQIKAFGQKNMPEEAFEALASSYEGVMALYNMMKSSEPKIIKNKSGQASGDVMDVEQLVRDPKYWREKDPAFVAKVTKAFERYYGK